jgi:hypothetical protein
MCIPCSWHSHASIDVHTYSLMHILCCLTQLQHFGTSFTTGVPGVAGCTVSHADLQLLITWLPRLSWTSAVHQWIIVCTCIDSEPRCPAKALL